MHGLIQRGVSMILREPRHSQSRPIDSDPRRMGANLVASAAQMVWLQGSKYPGPEPAEQGCRQNDARRRRSRAQGLFLRVIFASFCDRFFRFKMPAHWSVRLSCPPSQFISKCMILRPIVLVYSCRYPEKYLEMRSPLSRRKLRPSDSRAMGFPSAQCPRLGTIRKVPFAERKGGKPPFPPFATVRQ